MKHLLIILILLILADSIAKSQDSLLIFGNSIRLNKLDRPYLTTSSCSPLEKKYIEYEKIDNIDSVFSDCLCNCFEELRAVQTIIGVMYYEYECPKNRKLNRKIYSIIGRLKYDEIKSGQNPFIKSKDMEYAITGIKLKVVNDDNVKLIAFEFDSKYENLYSIINHILDNKEHLEYIIVDALYYVNEKREYCELPNRLIIDNKKSSR